MIPTAIGLLLVSLAQPFVPRGSTRPSFSLFALTPSDTNLATLKKRLLNKIDLFQTAQAIDGDVSVDFGVKGGELNATSRAPQKVDFYSISPAVGQAADDVLEMCDDLAACNPTPNATQFFGDRRQGSRSPLEGTWKLLFSTAADATFSKNSKRGDAQAQNVVEAAKGRITNQIKFLPGSDGKDPRLKQLNVILRAKAVNERRVALTFRYVKAVFSRFLFWPISWPLYIPVPGPFITRLIVLFYRIFRKGTVQKPPQAYFDILYLDQDLRVQRTGEDNIFVQARPNWKAAQGLFRA